MSIVVIVYSMSSQATNTLHTLSADYQIDVSANDYEVIVVENESGDMLEKKSISKFGKNFRYFQRSNDSVSPVKAINFGVEQAKSDFVCLMIDGARMVTPGIVHFAVCARNISKKAVVAVPGYHIGEELQQIAVQKGYNSEVEKKLLDSIDWKKNGYELFKIACLSGTSAKGFFHPLAESNCLCFTKKMYRKVGCCDMRFDLPGGGFVNLDLYKRLCEVKGAKLFMLLGEGSFHQLHGGVSTSESYERLQQNLVPQFKEQYKKIRGNEFFAPRTCPVYLGTVNKQALKFVEFSCRKALEQP